MSGNGPRSSAGLPLSVGAASTPVRLLIAAVFFAVALVCGAGGVFVATSGPLPAVIVAVAFLLPFAFIALIATMFVIAPLSRFGLWLDELVPTLGGPCGVAVAVVLWGIAAVIVIAVRLFYATPMRVALLLSLTLAGGCLPIPHPYQDLPRINGTITAGGVPLAGTRIQVADITRTNPCERAEQAAVTDAAGRFTTPGRRRIRLFVVPLPVHGFDTWAAAIIRDEQPVGYVRPLNYRAGPRYAPRDVELTCDLTTRECSVHNFDWDHLNTVELTPCEAFSASW